MSASENTAYKVVVHNSRPLYTVMRMAGLFYGNPLATQDEKPSVVLSYIGFFYCSAVFLSLLANVVRFTYQVAILHDEEHLIFYLGVAIWYLRCVVMSALMFIASKHSATAGKTSKLSAFYDTVHDFLRKQPVYYETRSTGYNRRSKIAFTVTLVLGMTFATANTFVIMTNADIDFSSLIEVYTAPAPLTTGTRIALCCVFLLCEMAWLLPMLFFLAICDSIIHCMDVFYDSLRCSATDNIDPTWKQPKQVRINFAALVQIAKTADGHLALPVFVMFVLDIILSCLFFYVALDAGLSWFVRASAFSWGMVGSLIMLTLSYGASRVADKGQEMGDAIQSIDFDCPDAKTALEVNLLLAMVGEQSIVMTIGTLVPMYKSVIVSVIVTVITYFTLIIQFKPQ